MKRSFVLLDGLRGVAALAVVVFHAAADSGFQPLPHGYLAVDFFFLLSGFVLASAYQDRLDCGWTTLQFLKVRFVRLYPLYLAGLFLGLSSLLIRKQFGQAHTPGAFLLLCLGFGLLLLPVPASQLAPWNLNAFPLDVPAWSLSSEAFANLVHAWCLRRRDTRSIALAAGGSLALLMVAAVRYHGIEIGAHRRDLLWALPRVLTSYMLGLLLYRIWRRRPRSIALPPWLAATTLVLLLAAPTVARWNVLFDLAAVLTVFPCLLFASATREPVGVVTALCSRSGATSYAVYVLHIPIREYFNQIWPRVTHRPSQGTLPLLVLLLIVVCLSLLADATYDRWVRAALTARLLRRTATQPDLAQPAFAATIVEPALD